MAPTKTLRRSSPCLCGSRSLAGECCLPIVRGEREAASAEALMRSRFVAYATGEIEHLVRSLHPDHVDLAIGSDALRASLRAACNAYRYTGLEVLSVEPGEQVSFVTFRARVFEKGRDLSFTERSRFLRTELGWRYLDGTTA
jgi:SEC-C motif-containing protein